MTDDEWQAHATREAAQAVAEWLEARGRLHQPIAGLGLADLEAMAAHERNLLEHATKELLAIDGLRIIGTAKEKVGVISFVIEGVHHYDLGTLLDQQGIAVRTGHHCTQPLMERFGVSGTTRASFACFNTIAEVEAMVAGVKRGVKMLR